MSLAIFNRVVQVSLGDIRHNVELGAQLKSAATVAFGGSHVHRVPLAFSRYHVCPVLVAATFEDGTTAVEQLDISIVMGMSTPQSISGKRIALYGNGQRLNASEQVRVANRGIGSFEVVEVEATSATLDFDLPLPSDAVILGTEVYLSEEFSGGSVASATLSCGTAAEPEALVDTLDVFTGAPVGPSTGNGGRPLGTYGEAQLQVVIEVTGGNLSDLVAGYATVNVYYTSSVQGAPLFSVSPSWDPSSNELTVTVSNSHDTQGMNVAVTSGMESWVQPLAPSPP